ncbi:SAV_6107 family HEPN domain-containing protein [Allostreptomyces psammosilenae]|uniref:SAV-6107-like HEPN domain-containing protein n=1 Tax=Allostreptomyces psammosilenae TaxID=1892865 RepID=A0A852ZXG3_9ACTN|nr:SAV_6107 family HEPN domain-containing protein [Allostreptomyces psammosilenae]NYI07083.1 hypothetical protein [Allostreptomyces psammosilenae]
MPGTTTRRFADSTHPGAAARLPKARAHAPEPRPAATGRPAHRPSAPASPVASGLLAHARRILARAEAAELPEERYAAAHYAALRTAAAVLSATTGPGAEAGGTVRRRRPAIRSAWEMLPEAAPELAGWAAVFAASATKRAVAEAGVPGSATAREAAELLRHSTEFLHQAEDLLDLHPQPELPEAPPDPDPAGPAGRPVP